MRISLLACFVVYFLFGCSGKNFGDQFFHLRWASSGKDVMWIPTQVELVDQMLKLAQISSEDILYDLGSGDGVIAIQAAKNFGARAVGVEYNSQLVKLAQRNAERAGVEKLVMFRQGDIFVTDFSEASVVTLYLGESVNSRLRTRLLSLKPGTRVISNTFGIETWIPDQILKPTPDSSLYLWIVPASIDGEWDISGFPGMGAARLKTIQTNQFFKGRLLASSTFSQSFEDGRVLGDRFNFGYKDGSGSEQIISGLIRGSEFIGSIEGRPEIQLHGRKVSP